MNAIKIVPTNEAKIEEWLKSVNGASHRHSYTDFEEIDRLADTAEKQLIGLLYKKDFPGARYASTSGAKVANAYDNMRNATHVVIERRNAGWYLVEVEKRQIGVQGGGRDRLFLTPAQDEAAKARFGEQYSVYRHDQK